MVTTHAASATIMKWKQWPINHKVHWYFYWNFQNQSN